MGDWATHGGTVQFRRACAAEWRQSPTRIPRIISQIRAVMRRPSQSVVRALAALRILAAQKGFDVERAMMQGCYRLIGADKLPAKHPDGSAGFTPKEATAFLERQPDAVTGVR
jgi:hypothetical protein